MTQPPKTISIPVPAAMHTAIGVLLALVTITAFWTHIEIPAGHPNKGTALGIGLLTGYTALTYWLWCGQQVTRSETQDVGEAIAAAETKAAEREQRILDAIGKTNSAMAVLAEEINDNHGAIKEVTDAVDAATAVINEVLGAVEALQNCYLADGRIHDPEEEPGTQDFALSH